MPNSLSVYTTNSNKIRNRNRNRNQIKNKNQEKERQKEKEINTDILKIEPVEQTYEYNCLFCFDPAQENNKLFRMKDVLLINSDCECNGNLHMKCLADWISVSKTCPICRDALTINLEIFRQIDTFHSSALTVKLNQIIRNFVNLFYAIVMIMTKYIAFLFLLNALFRVAKDIYRMIDK